MTDTTPTEKTRLLALAATGTLKWEYVSDMGGEWIRHNIGNGIDAILHEDEDNPTALRLTIYRYEAGEVLATSETATIKEAETMIGFYEASRTMGLFKTIAQHRGQLLAWVKIDGQLDQLVGIKSVGINGRAVQLEIVCEIH